MTLTEKIIKAHLVSGEMRAGCEVGIRIDQTLTQDATGTMAYLEFEAIGIPRVRTELSVSYVDHNMLQSDYRNMDDHRFLQSAAKKYGAYFSKPGNGICHQVHLERFGKPGKTLLGSDSHTPTSGGLGMLAIGAGGLDVAVAMGGGAFYTPMPKVVGVRLVGSLKPMVSAKDVILKLLSMETVKGGVGSVYEYFGPGVESLCLTDRATITNMGAELGATTSIFPSDERTREFLALQGREADYSPLGADGDASYARIVEIDLGALEPLAAMPHSPDNVKPVRELEGIEVQQVAIGSCTNSSINDLAVCAAVFKGRTLAENTSVGISPGSRQVLLSAQRLGIIDEFIRSGARLLESACGPCIGMGFAPSSGAVSLRTFNRNFEGRSGTPDARVYLVSPETAAVSAVHGVITDPRKHPVERANLLDKIVIDDSLVIAPASAEESSSIEVIRGPNIKPCPVNEAMPASIKAKIVLKAGDNITTDHIMPAGSKILPLRSNIPEIAKYVFSALDPAFYEKARAAGKGVIIGGENYGQGSSREHAALAPMFLGIKAVIAKSFARIHKANLVNFGIVPFQFSDPADYDALEEGMEIDFPSISERLASDTVAALAGGIEIKLTHGLDDRSVAILAAGGLLNYTRGADRR
jgi:aconitate hydratase